MLRIHGEVSWMLRTAAEVAWFCGSIVPVAVPATKSSELSHDHVSLGQACAHSSECAMAYCAHMDANCHPPSRMILVVPRALPRTSARRRHAYIARDTHSLMPSRHTRARPFPATTPLRSLWTRPLTCPLPVDKDRRNMKTNGPYSVHCGLASTGGAVRCNWARASPSLGPSDRPSKNARYHPIHGSTMPVLTPLAEEGIVRYLRLSRAPRHFCSSKPQLHSPMLTVNRMTAEISERSI
jgi:hypothetical protein